MGAASSVMTDEREGVKEENDSVRKRNLNNVIFDAGETNYADDASIDDQNIDIDAETEDFLISSLSKFFFMSQNQDIAKMMVKGMKREKIDANVSIITEGESGTNLFVVESGKVEVTMNGEFIRDMARGAIVGELALLYDAPRSATVRTVERSSFWTLSRDIFKKIQYISANASQVQRGKWMVQSPDLAKLTAIDLSKLVGTLQVMSFKTGDVIITEGQVTNFVYIIEKGKCDVTSSTCAGNMAPDVLKKLQLIKPKESASVESKDESGEGNCEVHEGCIIGLPVLKGKAGMAEGWEWTTVDGKTGGLSPLTMTATSDIEIIAFSAEVFETLLGSIEKVLSPGKSPKVDKEIHKNTERVFDPTRFKQMHVLGAGSFGTVTMAKYTESKTEPPVEYALKSLSKINIVETGQLRHVMDERLILSQMNSAFILRLFGTYQTPHTIVMVTEVVPGGDLWAVIYETHPFYRDRGIPHKLTAFYGTCLTLALSHIHQAGIVFRDLKPENVMLDQKGYLKLIDFGFAKKVPFMKKDANGEMKVYAKSYTLCGTPEYLSPELIFNLGHNQSADIWALGVMLYEMLMTITPFAPKRPDNITELFTNIAMVKKNGLVLSPKMNDHTKTPHSADIIMQLLKADPAERLGVQEGDTRCILNHPFFTSVIDEAAVMSGTEVPSFVPSINRNYDPISTIPPIRAFHGDQTLFDSF